MGNQIVTPASVTSAGAGIPWINPSGATGAGFGDSVPASITSVTISGNVVTFTTAPQQLQAGQVLAMSGFIINTFLNSTNLTVLSSGLTSTSFSANLNHANVTTTQDIGLGTPSTAYTTTKYIDYVNPPAGQYLAYSYAQTPLPGVVVSSRNFFGTPFSIYGSFPYIVFFNAASLGLNSYTGSMSSFTTPTLPVGATVQGIYLYCNGTNVGQPGAFISFTANWNDGTARSHTFATDGTNEVVGSIGTNLSILNTLSFTHFGQATSGGGLAYQNVADYGAYVVYSGSSGIVAGQLQSLQATNLGLSIPTNAFVTGVEVDFSAGTIGGSGTATAQAQLTLAGTPIGSTRSLSSIAGWSGPYTIGSSSDKWGTSLSGSQVNGSSGLGVNLSGVLANGAQLNLNSLVVKVYYAIPATVAHVTIATTRLPTVGVN